MLFNIPSNNRLLLILLSDKSNIFNLGNILKLLEEKLYILLLEKSNFELLIISEIARTEHLQDLVTNLKLNEYIKFKGFNKNPELFFKNSTLHLFPSISEAFPMVIIETKLFGIPNILIGLDYVSISKGGTIIIYDDTPETLARVSLKMLINKLFHSLLKIYHHPKISE